MIAHDPPQWARNARPANVAATGSAAPQQYSPIPEGLTPPVHTHRSHAAQYGLGRRYGFTVRGLVFHTTETDDGKDETDDFINTLTGNMWRAQTVSATSFCGEHGELGFTVPVDNRPWTTGRWNDETESLEIVGNAAWPKERWLDRPLQIEGITQWIVARCKARDIPARWLDADAWGEGASRHNITPFTMGINRGVTDHWTANQAAIALGADPTKYAHWDCGPALREILITQIIPEAARRLNPEEIPMHIVNGRAYDSRGRLEQWDADLREVNQHLPLTPMAAGEMREIYIGDTIRAQLNITVASAAQGFFTIANTPTKPHTSIVNVASAGMPNANTVTLDTPTNKVYIWASDAGMNLIVDVIERA